MQSTNVIDWLFAKLTERVDEVIVITALSASHQIKFHRTLISYAYVMLSDKKVIQSRE